MTKSMVSLDSVTGKLNPAVDSLLKSTFASKNQFNIKDYGAVGDGATNNRAALDATVAAVVASYNSQGEISLPPGTYDISTADSYGNGITLPSGVHLAAASPGTVRIRIKTTVTWGIQARYADTQIRGIEVAVIAGGTATYGVGVDTPNPVGSASNCSFTDLLVQSYGGGVLTNAFAVGPTHAGVGTVDIAQTTFTRCVARMYVSAGFFLGNATGANILNTRMTNCTAGQGQRGIYCRATNFLWTNGDFGYNSVSDVVTSTANAECKVDGFRSEGSAALWITTGANNGCTSHIANGWWSGDLLAAPGIFIDYNQSGTVNISNLIVAPSAVPPMIRLGDQFHVVLIVNGLTTETSLDDLITSGYSNPSKSSAVVTGYVQLSVGGADPTIARVPGPVRLGPSPDYISNRPYGYRTLRATETQSLAANGAVTLQGICETAAIKLSANATSSTIINAYFGQKYTLEWVQDGTGSRTYVWPTACRFAANTAPTPTVTANRSDSVTFRYDGALWREISRAINVPVS